MQTSFRQDYLLSSGAFNVACSSTLGLGLGCRCPENQIGKGVGKLYLVWCTPQSENIANTVVEEVGHAKRRENIILNGVIRGQNVSLLGGLCGHTVLVVTGCCRGTCTLAFSRHPFIALLLASGNTDYRAGACASW